VSMIITVDGREYEIVLGSDIRRDGMYLESTDLQDGFLRGVRDGWKISATCSDRRLGEIRAPDQLATKEAAADHAPYSGCFLWLPGRELRGVLLDRHECIDSECTGMHRSSGSGTSMAAGWWANNFCELLP
jgi:hypothetical protein